MLEVLVRVGKLLKTHRRDRGLMQEQIAQASGLSISMISAIERGERNVTVETLVAHAAALDLNVVIDLVPRDLSTADLELLQDVCWLIPHLDPHLKNTLRILVQGWGRQPR